MSDLPEKLLTVRDVCDRLQLDRRAVSRLLAKAKLPHLRVGSGRGVIRIRPEDLTAYEDSCRVQAATAQPVKQKQPAAKRAERWDDFWATAV